jgi:hypothetical protein
MLTQAEEAHIYIASFNDSHISETERAMFEPLLELFRKYDDIKALY